MLRTGIPYSVWAGEDEETVWTALDLIGEEDAAAEEAAAVGRDD